MAPPEVVSTKPFPLVPAFKERPILFSAPMVRALLDGSKTQTRRVVKPQPPHDLQHRSVDAPDAFVAEGEHTWWAGNHTQGIYHSARCPYGQPGDRLWVREAWAPKAIDPECTVAAYRATDDECKGPWTPSIHMPRWASRLDLEITGVRVERLQDISEADAIAEGIERREDACGSWKHYGDTGMSVDAIGSYRSLWERINGDESWKSDPWVWVVEFRRIRP